ncbi:hypothetical protein ACVBEH_31490, partial [Roseateles sp. GG27B]
MHSVVNGVEVYAVPMQQTRYMVLPKEWLKSLHFQQQQTARGISVLIKDAGVGKVDITFEFACDFV